MQVRRFNGRLAVAVLGVVCLSGALIGVDAQENPSAESLAGETGVNGNPKKVIESISAPVVEWPRGGGARG